MLAEYGPVFGQDGQECYPKVGRPVQRMRFSVGTNINGPLTVLVAAISEVSAAQPHRRGKRAVGRDIPDLEANPGATLQLSVETQSAVAK